MQNRLTRRSFSLLPAMLPALLPARAGAATLKIRLAGTPHPSMAPLHLAIEQGYFREQGFEIELIPLTRSAEAIPPLARGDIDVAVYGVSPPLINAIAKGARVRIVAARDRAMPDCGDTGSLYARKPVNTVAALRGKKVANPTRSTIVEFAFDAALAKAGLRPSDVEIVPLRPPEAVAAMMRGEIAALTGGELGALKALKHPDITLLATLGRTIPGYQFGFIMFGRKLLEGPVDDGARFLRAYFRGVREYLNGATPRFVDELAASTGADAKDLKSQCRTHAIPGGRLDIAALTRFTKWAFERGFSERLAEAGALIDERFYLASQKG